MDIEELMKNPVIMPGHDPDSWVATAKISAEIGKPVSVEITPREGYETCVGCEMVCECGEHHPHITLTEENSDIARELAAALDAPIAVQPMVVEKAVLNIRIDITHGKDSNIVATYLMGRISALFEDMRKEGTLCEVDLAHFNIEDEIVVL